MPETERFWNSNTKRYESREVMSTGDVESAQSAEKYGTTAGKGLGAKAAKSEGMPKQKEGESPSDYGERLRRWRESQKQKSAFEKKE